MKSNKGEKNGDSARDHSVAGKSRDLSQRSRGETQGRLRVGHVTRERKTTSRMELGAS